MALTPNEVAEVLESAWEARDEIVPCLIGEPGIGKTQGIYDFAAKKGAKVVEIIASQILPNEVSGITMPVNETHSMEIYDHARLSTLEDGDILFFDELLQASTQTLSACLTLIQERRMMSGKKLPDIMIVAAANPLASPNCIPLSIRQRFMFITVAWHKGQWAEWIAKKYKVTPTEELLRDIMSDNGTEYNALTPRTATKLIEWGIKSRCDEGWKTCVSNMFSAAIEAHLQKTCGTRPQQLKVAAEIRAMDLEMTPELQKILDNIEDCSLADLYNNLIELEQWPEIEKVLGGIKI